VLPYGDASVAGLAGDAPGQRYTFGGPSGEANAGVHGGYLWLGVDESEEPLMPTSDLPLLGSHNALNALAAAVAARLAGLSPDAIARGLRSTRPLPHRMQPVAEADGILWVNDSKATNVAATLSALASVDRPVVLLLGGKDKGESFTPLAAALRGRVRHALVYGAAAERIAREVGDATSVEVMGADFRAVVARATDLAQEGDMILLSPACSSFDMFTSYEHRGRSFTALAEELA
jgi:UDP-N-acetylmuramoylalanine--D-glutamate ligase